MNMGTCNNNKIVLIFSTIFVATFINIVHVCMHMHKIYFYTYMYMTWTRYNYDIGSRSRYRTGVFRDDHGARRSGTTYVVSRLDPTPPIGASHGIYRVTPSDSTRAKMCAGLFDRVTWRVHCIPIIFPYRLVDARILYGSSFSKVTLLSNVTLVR